MSSAALVEAAAKYAAATSTVLFAVSKFNEPPTFAAHAAGPSPKFMQEINPKYHIQPLSAKQLFSPSNISWVLIKNLGLITCVHVNTFMIDTIKADQEAEAQNADPVYPPPPSVKTILWQAQFNATRELIVLTVRSIYEHIVAAICLPRSRWKLLKKYQTTGVRKIERLGTGVACCHMVRTAIRSNLLHYAADFLVSISEAVVHTIRDSSIKRRREYILRRVAFAAIRNMMCLAIGSVGAGVGLLVHPTLGPLIGFTVFELGATFGVQLLVWPWVLDACYHEQGDGACDAPALGAQ